MNVERSRPLPIGAIALGLIGAAALVLGILGLVGSGASVHPMLENSAIAWSLIAVGVVFTIIEVVAIINYATARRAG